MGQSSKDKFLSQKNVSLDLMLPFEKIIYFLLFIFILAVPLALVIRMDIMIYVGLLDIFILSAAAIIKPSIIIELIRKKKTNFEEKYGEKLPVISMIFRILGVYFFGVAIIILRNLVLQ